MILRFFAGVMVRVTIVTVNVALLGCTLYAYNMAGLLSKAGQFGATIAAQLPMDSDPTGGSTQLGATYTCQLLECCDRGAVTASRA